MTTATKPTRPDFMTNEKGHNVPIHLVKETDLIVDDAVKLIHNHTVALMSQIARFRSHTDDDLGALLSLLEEEYGVHFRGRKKDAKGNVSFKSYDGLTKVEVRIQDYTEYGPELQVAKTLIDEYIEEVSEDAPDAVKVLLTHAFETDKPGKVRRDALYGMQRLNVEHPLWVKAMQAIKDAIRITNSRAMIVVSSRASTAENFKALPINLPNAYEVVLDDDEEGGDA